MDMREAFEVWAGAQGFNTGKMDVADTYADRTTWVAWFAWQAALQSHPAIGSGAEPVDMREAFEVEAEKLGLDMRKTAGYRADPETGNIERGFYRGWKAALQSHPANGDTGDGSKAKPVGHFYNDPKNGRVGVEWCCDHLDSGTALFVHPAPTAQDSNVPDHTEQPLAMVADTQKPFKDCELECGAYGGSYCPCRAEAAQSKRPQPPENQ